MRIGIDGRAFVSPAGGVRRYTWELTQALLCLEPTCRIIAIGLDDARHAPAGVRPRAARLTLPTNLGWSISGLPLAGIGARLDVFHAPAYTAPLVGLRPRVVTIHDVSYARTPGDYPYRSDSLRRWFYRRSAIGADAVITDSEFSRREIANAYGLAPEHIAVVPLGVGAPFGMAPDSDARRPLPAGATVPFVLHLGDLHPRRRPALLLDAVLRVRAAHAQLRTLQIVFAGRDHAMIDALGHQAESAGAPAALCAPGILAEQDVVALLQRASALVYASRYEGFGLPLLEAMACGTPVVAVRVASVEEVVGQAGVLVEDSPTGAPLADALGPVLLEPALAARLRADGLARAATFTWARTAAATLAVYRRVAQVR